METFLCIKYEYKRMPRPMKKARAKKSGAGAEAAGEFTASRNFNSIERVNFLGRFRKLMDEHGFAAVDAKKMEEDLRGKKLWKEGGALPIVEGGELIFNRGISAKPGKGTRANGKSNFYVFVREKADSVEIFYSNPEPKKGEDRIIHRVFITGNYASMAGKYAMEILAKSQRKPLNDYWADTHGHWGYVGEKPVQDDGVCRFQDRIRTMMLYHLDYDMTSPHNSFETMLYRLVHRIGKHTGMVKVPATELTLSTEPPNGPHAVIWMDGERTANDVRREILSQREPLEMISCFSGMKMDAMFRKLAPLRKEGKLAVGIAHPVNYSGRRLPLFEIGLVTAAEDGSISVDKMVEVALQCDAAACWNPSLDGKGPVPIEDGRLRNRLWGLINAHGVGKSWRANPLNMAFAMEMQKHGLHTTYDPDDHRVLPIVGRPGDYLAGGDALGMGRTVITLTPSQFSEMREKGRKPWPSELIPWIVKREVRMEGKAFTKMHHGDLIIDPAAAAMPKEKKKLDRILRKHQGRRYVKWALHDIGYLLAHGKWKELGNLDAD